MYIRLSLAAKPQAFRFSQFRDDLRDPQPNIANYGGWQSSSSLRKEHTCKWMVAVLRFAADYDCEGSLAYELMQAGRAEANYADLTALQAKYCQHATPPAIPLRQHQVTDYDQLTDRPMD